MTHTNSLAQLRSLLSETPSVQTWWCIANLLHSSPPEELDVFVSYTREHTSSNPLWKNVLVPCGDWEPDALAHELSSLQINLVEQLFDAEEIYCPPGTFLLGAPDEDEEAGEEEQPQREMTLTNGFWMLSTPVTQAMYERIVGESPSYFQGKNRPVEQVDWWNVIHFCNELSRLEGLEPVYSFEMSQGDFGLEEKVRWEGYKTNGYRLPTEAEWEYACRAGCTAPRYGELDDIGWHLGNSAEETHEVGQKQPNAWGLYDMIGNVWEWVFDKDRHRAYEHLAEVDPIGRGNWSSVTRGGSCLQDSLQNRASARHSDDDSCRDRNLGFRVVRTAL